MSVSAVSNAAVPNHSEGTEPALEGEYRLPDGARVKPAFQLLRERLEECTPEWAAQITGIPPERIRALWHCSGMT